jgi:hypothetical protein
VVVPADGGTVAVIVDQVYSATYPSLPDPSEAQNMHTTSPWSRC